MAGTGYAGSDEYKWANCVSGTGWSYAVAEETLLCEVGRKTIFESHGLLDTSNEWGNKMENTTEKKSNEFQEEQERCFVIMPISDQGDYPKGHFTKVYNQILLMIGLLILSSSTRNGS